MPSLCSAGPQLLKEQRLIPLPDLIARFHANPLRNGAVLLLLLREEAFDLEGLVRRHSAARLGVPTMAAAKEAEGAWRGRGGDAGPWAQRPPAARL